MIASRVGILGALAAVLVLTAELAGGVALKHRLTAEDTCADRIGRLEGIATSLRAMAPTIEDGTEATIAGIRAGIASMDVKIAALKRCLVDPDPAEATRRLRESEDAAREALETAITARKHVDRIGEDPRIEWDRTHPMDDELIDVEIDGRPVGERPVRNRDGWRQVPNRAGY